MKSYRIRNWENLFENNRSRTVKDLSWVAIPNRHDGENFSAIMLHPKGAEIFAAWVLILQVASRCQPRGSLLRDGGKPHTPKTLSIKTRAPEEWFVIALEFLANETDWIEVEELALGCQPGVSQPTAACQVGDEEGNGREGNGKNGSSAGAGALADLEGFGLGNTSKLEAPHAKRASEPASSSAKPKTARSHPDHQKFIDAWCGRHLLFWRREYPVESRDAGVVGQLLNLGVAWQELVEIAVLAWGQRRDNPYATACKKSVTIFDVRQNLAAIRAELDAVEHQKQNAPATHAKPHRNDFIAGAGTGPSTTEILRRRAAREAAERAAAAGPPVAAEVAGAGRDASQGAGGI